jgi:hypothetical protein
VPTCRLADGRTARAAIKKWHDVRLRSTHGILIALDMESLDQMRRVVEQTTVVEGIVGYKVGLTATLRLGLGGEWATACVVLLDAIQDAIGGLSLRCHDAYPEHADRQICCLQGAEIIKQPLNR